MLKFLRILNLQSWKFKPDSLILAFSESRKNVVIFRETTKRREKCKKQVSKGENGIKTFNQKQGKKSKMNTEMTELKIKIRWQINPIHYLHYI